MNFSMPPCMTTTGDPLLTSATSPMSFCKSMSIQHRPSSTRATTTMMRGLSSRFGSTFIDDDEKGPAERHRHSGSVCSLCGGMHEEMHCALEVSSRGSKMDRPPVLSRPHNYDKILLHGWSPSSERPRNYPHRFNEQRSNMTGTTAAVLGTIGSCVDA